MRVTMSTICRSDIHSYEGRRPNPCPGILGHEIVGVIEELGAGIDKDMRGDSLEVGDRITWSEYFFDGHCYYREVLDMPQKCPGVRKYGHDLAGEGAGQDVAVFGEAADLRLKRISRTLGAARWV